MSLRYTLERFVFEFHKNRMGDDVIMTYLQTIVHISISNESIHFVLGTNKQRHIVHLTIKMKVTLTDDEGHRRRSKVTKKRTNDHISQIITLIIPGTKVQRHKLS